jgi:hypothetical protein
MFQQQNFLIFVNFLHIVYTYIYLQMDSGYQMNIEPRTFVAEGLEHRAKKYPTSSPHDLPEYAGKLPHFIYGKSVISSWLHLIWFSLLPI